MDTVGHEVDHEDPVIIKRVQAFLDGLEFYQLQIKNTGSFPSPGTMLEAYFAPQSEDGSMDDSKSRKVILFLEEDILVMRQRKSSHGESLDLLEANVDRMLLGDELYSEVLDSEFGDSNTAPGG